MSDRVSYTSMTADTVIKTGRALYRGYTVTVAVATAAIDIRDAATAGAGTVIDTIPVGTAAGTQRMLPDGVVCTAGLVADYGAGATGTVVVLFE